MKLLLSIIVLFVVVAGALYANTTRKNSAESDLSSDPGVYSFSLVLIDGSPMPLAQFKGKIVLLVNVASKCGFTSQYKDLEALYQKYKDRGLVIIGVPANNFGNQEPGSNKAIQEFCSLNYGVTFPMAQKISVNGEDMHALYRYLTTTQPDRRMRGGIKWNFNKFLIDRSGQVVARYGSFTNPMSDTVRTDIDRLLGM